MRYFAPLAAGLLAILVSCPVCADEPVKESAAELALTGTVVDAAGNPVKGADITPLHPDDIAPITTNADGDFRIPLKEAIYRNRVGETLYFEVHASKGDLLGTETISAKLGEIEPVKITVKPAHEIAVQVTHQGEPVEGAEVMTVNRHTLVDSGRTDAEGKWIGRLSPDAEQWHVMARMPGIGFNYEQAGRPSINNPPVKPLPDDVSLQLNGVHTLRVKVIDMRGEPLAGVRVEPWLVRTAGQEDLINLTGVSVAEVETNSQGMAVFDWLPSDFTSMTITAGAEGKYALDRSIHLETNDHADEVTFTMLPKETLSGRVTDAEGKPVAGIGVHAKGVGAGTNRGRGSAVTDAEGHYELNLNAEQAYLIRVADETWAAPWQAPVALYAGKPVTGVDFSLIPATKLYGRVTAGEESKPIQKEFVRLSIEISPIPQDLFAPESDDGGIHNTLLDYLYTYTDKNGHYEFHLGPGDYSLRRPGDSSPRDEPIRITIPVENPPAEIEKNIHLDHPLKSPLTVTVVDQEGKPVSDATLSGRYKGHPSHGWSRPVVANDKGIAKTERGMTELVIQGASPDETLKGIARVDAEAAHAKVILFPTGSATGIVLDTSGDAVANEELTYGIPLTWKSGEFTSHTWAFGGHVTTDGQGRFTINGLVPDESYELRLPLGEHRWQSITAIKVPGAETLDLGEFEVYAETLRATLN